MVDGARSPSSDRDDDQRQEPSIIEWNPAAALQTKAPASVSPGRGRMPGPALSQTGRASYGVLNITVFDHADVPPALVAATR